jgi:hypothetical protein
MNTVGPAISLRTSSCVLLQKEQDSFSSPVPGSLLLRRFPNIPCS